MNLTLPYTGRLAPSPTGALHLGNVRTFVIAWLRARKAGGRVIMRMDDLDHPRDKPGADVAALADLRWLGFDWDEEFTQSARRDIYRGELEKLKSQGFVYPCICSRKDVESAQSAPHAGEQLWYGGACRNRFSTWDEAEKIIAPRTPVWRFHVQPSTVIRFEDGFAGSFGQDVSSTLGDFPVARDKDGAGYTLASTVDDALMGITEVVRGDDLLAATPAQILIARSLGYNVPRYYHVPLVVGANGMRLAKRHGDTRICAYRAAGIKAERIIGLIAHWCGWAEKGEELTLQTLLGRCDFSRLPSSPVVYEAGNL